MSKSPVTIERIGQLLAILGGVTLAGIFLVVLVNGTWPAFLRPVQQRFALASDFFGSAAFIVELLVFVGPGLLISYLGQRFRKT